MTRKIVIDPGNVVVCDFCSEDYADRPDPGGMLFGTRTACPKCAGDRLVESLQGNDDIVVRLNSSGKSFADWVREDLR